MAKLLSKEELQTKLKELPGWHAEGTGIMRFFKLASFTDVMVLVNEVAQLAEDANHHPDIDIRFNTVRFVLTSHDAGGVTEKDVALAKQINATESSIAMDEG